MIDIAGTSALTAFDRQSGARAEMESFRAAMGPAIMGSRGLGAEEVVAWSTRRLIAPSLVAWASLGWLLAWVLLAWGTALIVTQRSERLG
jgi:hypothetical protein